MLPVYFESGFVADQAIFGRKSYPDCGVVFLSTAGGLVSQVLYTYVLLQKYFLC